MKLTMSAIALAFWLPTVAAAQQLDLRLGGGIHLGSPRVSLERSPGLTGGATLWLTRSIGLEIGGSRSWTEWQVFDSARVAYRDAPGSITQTDVRGVVVVGRDMPLDGQFSVGFGRIWYRGEAYREEVTVPKLALGLELSYPMTSGTRFLVAADYAGYRPYGESWKGRQHDVLLTVGVRARLLSFGRAPS
jgi:hypothetical protein